MLLNDDIIDIEIPDGICSLVFVADGFSGLSLHPSVCSIIHLRSAKNSKWCFIRFLMSIIF